MEVAMISYDYTILYSENTITYSLSRIYPRYDIGIDMDNNQIVDDWEMPLAQKFCPVLFAPVDDSGDGFGVPTRTDGFFTPKSFGFVRASQFLDD